MLHKTAVAYYRTSSAANVGGDKDSERRQREAVASYAKAHRIEIVQEFYDAAVSGSDPIDQRPGFVELMEYMAGNGARVILVENASRFARDLVVQLTGHELLKARGYDLIPVDAPDHFIDETPTACMVRQILGSPVPDAVVQRAKSLARKRLKAGTRSLREIAAVLASEGYRAPSGKVYNPNSIRQMLQRQLA